MKALLSSHCHSFTQAKRFLSLLLLFSFTFSPVLAQEVPPADPTVTDPAVTDPVATPTDPVATPETTPPAATETTPPIVTGKQIGRAHV